MNAADLLRWAGQRIFVRDIVRIRNRSALKCKLQCFESRTFRKKRDKWKGIAPIADKVDFPMRDFADTIAIEIEFRGICPNISAAIFGPAVVIVAAGQVNVVQIEADIVVMEKVVRGVRRQAHSDIVVGDPIAARFVCMAVLHVDAGGVPVDVVILDDRPVDVVQEQAVGSGAAVFRKMISVDDDILGKHQSGSGDVVFEKISGKIVVVGIHIVEPVAGGENVVVFNGAFACEGEIDAVPGVGNSVSRDQVSGGIPEVGSISASILSDDTNGIAAGSGGAGAAICDVSFLNAPDFVVVDFDRVGFADVDSVKRIVNEVVFENGPISLNVDSGLIATQIQARMADPETVDSHIGRENPDRFPILLPFDMWEIFTAESQRFIDNEISVIMSGWNDDHRSRFRLIDFFLNGKRGGHLRTNCEREEQDGDEKNSSIHSYLKFPKRRKRSALTSARETSLRSSKVQRLRADIRRCAGNYIE